MNNNFAKTMEIIVPSQEENDVLEKMDSWYETYTEMSSSQRKFINSLILRKKPMRVLELGVSDGGSSCVILNALEHIGQGKLVSIDLADRAYKRPDCQTGWCVEHYPELSKRRKLYTGQLAYKFMNEVQKSGGTPFEFVFIDTVHMLPGEILDFLMVFPYIAETGTVVFHDISLHHRKHLEKAVPTALLMSAIHGKKLLEEGFSSVGESCIFPNIAAVELNNNSADYLFEIFNILTFRWHYLLNPETEEDLTEWFHDFYGPFFAHYFQAVCAKQHENSGRKMVFKEFIKRQIPPHAIRFLSKIRQHFI